MASGFGNELVCGYMTYRDGRAGRAAVAEGRSDIKSDLFCGEDGNDRTQRSGEY
jgi:hypothetical protein